MIFSFPVSPCHILVCDVWSKAALLELNAIFFCSIARDAEQHNHIGNKKAERA
jgi:hypothetical protein